MLTALEDVARRAGAVIMDVYGSDFAVRAKVDASPVTEADERAEAVILPELARLLPGVPIVAEEEAAAGRIPAVGERFWLVDPLDGTKQFVRRNGEFTVNIGLIENGIPTVGVVFAPALGLLWSAAGGRATTVDAQGRHPLACRRAPERGAVVLASRSHNNAERLADWLAGCPEAQVTHMGSSLKICRIAEGTADFAPRSGPTSEWDTAAAHAVLLAAGGRIETFDGQPLAYGKPGFRNPDFLVRGR